MAEKQVYFFGSGKADGSAKMKNLLGGKGANLAEMSRLAIPVPAGFTITTNVCTYFMNTKGKYPSGLAGEVDAALKKVEKTMGMQYGDAKDPLLFSVRSGARISMPDRFHRPGPSSVMRGLFLFSTRPVILFPVL